MSCMVDACRPICRTALLLVLCSSTVVVAQTNPQAAPATLTVSGDIPSPLTLKSEDLANMPRETVSIPDQDATKVDYGGVPLRAILKRAGAPQDKDLRGKALTTTSLLRRTTVTRWFSPCRSWTRHSPTNIFSSRISGTGRPCLVTRDHFGWYARATRRVHAPFGCL